MKGNIEKGYFRADKFPTTPDNPRLSFNCVSRGLSIIDPYPLH
jgi:hypothetical protein